MKSNNGILFFGISCLLLLSSSTLSRLSAQEPAPAAATPATAPAQESRVASFAGLVEFYKSQKIMLNVDEPNESLQFAMQKENFSGVMVVKWDGRNGVCHFIQTMSYAVPEDKVQTYLLAASRLNHGFLFPGIGINLDNLGTYYRLTVPVAPKGYLSSTEVGTFSNFTLNKAVEFLPTLKEVLDGKVAVKDVVAHHQQKMIARAKQNAAQPAAEDK